jgi:hypothetical protein
MKDSINPMVVRVRKSSWKYLASIVCAAGWVFIENKPNIKKFERGHQQISVVKISPKKWKVEYFSNNRLVDSAGIADEQFAKVLAVELAVVRTFAPYPFR